MPDSDGDPGGDPSDREILWRQYSTNVDLYKFHIDSTIKVNGFTFLVTGGVMGYVLNARPDAPPVTRYALLLPILLSLGLAFAMAAATRITQGKKQDVAALRRKLKLDSALSLALLQLITASFAVVHLGIAVALTWFLLGYARR